MQLLATRYPAAGERRGVVLATHAMMASSRYLDRPRGGGFASTLAAAGLETWLCDFRGHGESKPVPRPPSFDDFVRLDLPAAMAHVARRAGVAEGDIVYMGHSLGGLAGLASFGVRGPAAWPAALVLFASHLWLGVAGRRRALIEAWALLTRLFGRMPGKLLRFGTEDVPARYSRQFVHWARSGRWDSEDGSDYAAAAATIARPMLLVAGDRDRLCRPDEARAFAPGHPELVVVPGASHFGLFDRAVAGAAWRRVIEFTLPVAAAHPGR